LDLVLEALRRAEEPVDWLVMPRLEQPEVSVDCLTGPDNRVRLAVGRTKDGVNELEAAEKAAAARGHHNPVHVFGAADLARALATEDPARAARLAVDVRRRAERLGTD
ncbi:ATP-grasp domain-containing protein, partial [Streptomyces sp. IpFD-1.1]|uniref:ATP-grasp domain-containing protein n=1 Tax=Streptomyces sp. IpFD-1.1 TaxID=2841664 RepID=UPI0020941021